MDYNYTLKYRTFDSLLEDVKMDLRNLSADTSIEPAQLIKVARKCNYDLGLRIQKTKETVLEIEKGKARLPEDFQVMNFALICGNYTIVEVPPQGTNVQEIAPGYRPWIESNTCSDCNGTSPETTCMTQCGTDYTLVQMVNTVRREFRTFAPISFRSSQFVDVDCPNACSPRWQNKDEAYIKDGWVYTNFTDGNVYINYQADMVDDENNILVPDHPMLNEYYEYALKKRILENLVLDNVNVSGQYQLISNELRVARNAAFSIVNTPNFSEMMKMWVANRKAMYSKYYNMFRSYYTPVNLRVNNAI
jgi:hypothetical protein